MSPCRGLLGFFLRYFFFYRCVRVYETHHWGRADSGAAHATEQSCADLRDLFHWHPPLRHYCFVAHRRVAEVQRCEHLCVCVCVCVCLCVCTYIYGYMYTHYMYIHIYTHIHVHTHIHTAFSLRTRFSHSRSRPATVDSRSHCVCVCVFVCVCVSVYVCR
jgi:hypothetical protein